MKILISLLPAIFWGFTPFWVNVCKGKPIQQLVGTTYGALVIGIIIWLIKQPVITATDFWWCFLGGIGWSLGQLSQYRAFKNLSVSTTSPMAAGVQLVGVDVVGVLFFGSWASGLAKLIGFSAIILIILGVFLTTRTGQSKSAPSANKKFLLKNILELLAGCGIGYTACSTLPRIPNVSGWTTFPPQTVGMLFGAVAFALIIKKFRQQQPLTSHSTFKNIFSGFNSGIGTFFYLTSMILNGVSTGFTMSQMTTVVATFVGLVILHEHKHGKSLIYTLSGVTLVVIGGIMTGFIH